MPNKPSYILGINAYDHDVAACLLRDGEVAYAIAKERITREKHATGFYQEVVDYVLDAEGIALRDVDLVVRNCYILPVEEMEQRLYARDVSFDPQPDADDDEPAAPVAYLPSPGSDPAQQLADEDWAERSEERLAEALDSLDARSQDILRKRWLEEPKQTLHELAEKYGVSAERIRQLEANAMKKLRGRLAAA